MQTLKWGRLNSDALFGIDTGKSKLYLDYGKHSGMPEKMFHWNTKKGAASMYGISDHTPALGKLGVGKTGALLNRGTKVVKYGSRGLIVGGIAVDAYEIANSNNKLRTAAVKAGGWTGAWAGAKVGAAGLATIGSLGGPVGATVGGAIGGIVGGISGYFTGEKIVKSVIRRRW